MRDDHRGREELLEELRTLRARLEQAEALREGEEKYRGIFENAVEGLFQVSPAGRFLTANPALARMLGYASPQELVAQVTEVGQLLADPGRRAELRRLLEERGAGLGFEAQLYRKDRTRMWASVSARVCRDAAGRLLYYEGSVEDVSRARQAQALLTVQKQVLEAVSTDATLAEVLEGLVAAVEGQSEGMLCVLLLDEGGSALRPVAARGLPAEYLRAIDPVPVGPRAGSCGTAAFLGRPVLVADVAADPLWEDYRGPALAAGFRACWSAPIRSRDGRVLGTFAMYYRQPRLPDEQDLRLLEVATDLAALAVERKRQDEELRRQKEALQSIFDHIPVMIRFMDPTGRVQLVNRHWERVLGWSLEEAQSRDVFAEFYPDPEYRRQVFEFIERAAPGWFDFKTRVRDGRTLETAWASVRLSDGTRIGIGQDVSERKEAERLLREREERYRVISELTSDYIYSAAVGSDGRVVTEWVTAAFERITGYTAAEVNARGGWPAVIHPEDLAGALEFGRSLAANRPGVIEYRIVTKGGEARWLRDYARPEWDPAQGRVVRILGAVQDVTERRRAEDRLRRSEQYHRLIAELTSDYAYDCSVDAGGAIRLESVTEGFTRITGFTLEEALARGGWPSLIHPDDQHVIAGSTGESAAGLGVGEVRIRTKSGETRWIRYSTRGLREPGSGRVVRLVGAVRDVTEEKRAEERLRAYAGRMRALSRRLVEVQEQERRHLARELHDEVGQLLTGLKFALEASAPPGPAGARLGEARALIGEALTRVRELSFDLRPALLDHLGLLPALRALIERYSASTGVRVSFKQAGLERRFAPELETAAYRVVQEALTNVARHAGVREATVRVWVDEEALEVQVEDQGVGFDPEAVLAAGRSSGLPGMHERVTLLGGRLAVESTPGGGTHLMAELPLGGLTGGG